jgi:hypothetical protein
LVIFYRRVRAWLATAFMSQASQIPSILQRLLVMRNEHKIIGDREGDQIHSGGLIVSADNRRMIVIMVG